MVTETSEYSFHCSLASIEQYYRNHRAIDILRIDHSIITFDSQLYQISLRHVRVKVHTYMYLRARHGCARVRIASNIYEEWPLQQRDLSRVVNYVNS